MLVYLVRKILSLIESQEIFRLLVIKLMMKDF